MLVADAICGGLAARDAWIVASGAPARLRPLPALLLRVELSVAVAATGLGLAAATSRSGGRTTVMERRRRAAVAILFAVHTSRFWIYLRPGQGRRPTP